MLKVYVVQMESQPSKLEQNLLNASKLIYDACPQRDSLIVLPEMFATGYFPQYADELGESYLQEDLGETGKFLNKLADETHCTIIGGGIKKDYSEFKNHVGIFVPGTLGEASGYDKIHPFFPEQHLFTAGKNITLFKTCDFTISPSICFDLRFPELFREATQKGADIFTIHAAWPAKRKDHWETLLKARAIENQAYIVASNCITSDGAFSGDSQIISPFGEILAKAPAQKECVIEAFLDIQTLKRYRNDFPVLGK